MAGPLNGGMPPSVGRHRAITGKNVTSKLCPVCRTPLHRLLVQDGERVHWLCGPEVA